MIRHGGSDQDTAQILRKAKNDFFMGTDSIKTHCLVWHGGISACFCGTGVCDRSRTGALLAGLQHNSEQSSNCFSEGPLVQRIRKYWNVTGYMSTFKCWHIVFSKQCRLESPPKIIQDKACMMRAKVFHRQDAKLLMRAAYLLHEERCQVPVFLCFNMVPRCLSHFYWKQRGALREQGTALPTSVFAPKGMFVNEIPFLQASFPTGHHLIFDWMT